MSCLIKAHLVTPNDCPFHHFSCMDTVQVWNFIHRRALILQSRELRLWRILSPLSPREPNALHCTGGVSA